jgi:predicted RNase H-like nuclease (RuvC/YqgF family)
LATNFLFEKFLRAPAKNPPLTTNRALHQSITTLNKELSQLRARPSTVYVNKAHSDETDNKITQLSSDNERLKIQLKDKLEQNELLKIKLNLKSESQDSLDRKKPIFSFSKIFF